MDHDVCENVISKMALDVQVEFSKCIECGSCYISCPFDLWGATDEDRRQAVKDNNDFIFNAKKITPFLKQEIFRCAECDICHRTCPVDIHRKHANLLTKLKIKPKNVDRLRAHPARLSGTKQYLFEKLNVKKWTIEEKGWYDSLNTDRQADVLVYHGCYVASTKKQCIKLDKMLKYSGVDFVTFGKFEYCCGNFGLYRGVQDMCATSPKIQEMIEISQPKEIITNCGHCKEAVENIVKQMGLSDCVNVIHPADKILKLVLDKKLKLEYLSHTITIQDSCLNKLNQSDSVIRTLLARIVEISENKDSLHKAYCCGDVAHIADPEGVHNYNKNRVRTFFETQADFLTVYCAGCYDIFSAFKAIKTKDLIDIVYESWTDKGEDYVS